MEFSQRGNSKAIRPLANSRPPCADSDSGIKMMTGEKCMGILPKEEKLFTYADYKAWELKEGERYELIYGKIYPMFGAGAGRTISIAPGWWNTATETPGWIGRAAARRECTPVRSTTILRLR